jgi:hypothetical protein
VKCGGTARRRLRWYQVENGVLINEAHRRSRAVLLIAQNTTQSATLSASSAFARPLALPLYGPGHVLADERS